MRDSDKTYVHNLLSAAKKNEKVKIKKKKERREKNKQTVIL